MERKVLWIGAMTVVVIIMVLICIACVLTAQIRHGAATALREVIKHHGDTAGISAYTPEPNVR